MDRKTVLSIAGSDCSGGAGIQADLKTMLANGVYGMCAITALTAQNTCGVNAINVADTRFLGDQIDAVFQDIIPDATKIGMISTEEHAKIIAEKLKFYNAKNIVVDPVMVATSGADLSSDKSVMAVIDLLFPISKVTTPNILEAQTIIGKSIKNSTDMEKAALEIYTKHKCATLVKGGHSINNANDVLCEDGKITWFKSDRIENNNTHGTGCTLSSAIASNLAKGIDLVKSIELAKKYITKILKSDLNLGAGSGPLDHGFEIEKTL